MTRTIYAKFPSKCTQCGGRIFAGDRIVWTKGVKGVYHANCGDAGDDNDRGAEPENYRFGGERPPVTDAPVDVTRPAPAWTLKGFLAACPTETLPVIAGIVADEIAKRAAAPAVAAPVADHAEPMAHAA